MKSYGDHISPAVIKEIETVGKKASDDLEATAGALSNAIQKKFNHATALSIVSLAVSVAALVISLLK